MRNALSILSLLAIGCAPAAPQAVSTDVPSPTPRRASVLSKMDGPVKLDLTASKTNDGRVRVSGTTNLPSGTDLVISLKSDPPGGLQSQDHQAVGEDGAFQSAPLGPREGLLSGTYAAEVVVPVSQVQPEHVRKVIGPNGENLSGPLVERGRFGATASNTCRVVIEDGPGKLPDVTISNLGTTSAGRRYLREKLAELDSFKGDPKFHTMGFSDAGPFHPWLADLQSHREAPEFGLFDKTEVADLMLLGTQYMRTKGLDNEQTQRHRAEIMKVLESAEARKEGEADAKEAGAAKKKTAAATRLKMAKALELKNIPGAIKYHRAIVDEFPGTPEAAESLRRIESLKAPR